MLDTESIEVFAENLLQDLILDRVFLFIEKQ